MHIIELSRRDWLKTATTMGLAAAGSSMFPTKTRADRSPDQAAIDIGTTLELFVDRKLIDRLEGTQLELHAPRPAGIALKYDQPWEGEFSFVPTVIKDGDTYRMYYRGLLPWKSGEPLVESTCYAQSSDGIHWTKPKLGLVELLGSKDNNAIFEGSGFGPFLDNRPGVPASEHLKGLRPPPRLSTEIGVRLYASADGVHWRLLQDEAVYSGERVGAVSWSQVEQQYIQYARIDHENIRTVGRATAPDLLDWTDFAPVDFGNAPPTNREQLYEIAALPYYRAPHICIGLAARFMASRRVLNDEQLAAIRRHKLGGGGKGIADMVLITTRAGSTCFDRTFQEGFVRPGLGDHYWASRGNYPGRGVVPTGPAEMSIYVNRHYGQPTNHVERLVLRTDGFVSVRAPYGGGEMVTKPLKFAAGRLVINYATSAAGDIRVEIQDESGNAIPEFTLADCLEIIGDEIERVVKWKKGSDVSRLAGRIIRLRFVMKDADLYSIRFAQGK